MGILQGSNELLSADWKLWRVFKNNKTTQQTKRKSFLWTKCRLVWTKWFLWWRRRRCNALKLPSSFVPISAYQYCNLNIKTGSNVRGPWITEYLLEITYNYILCKKFRYESKLYVQVLCYHFKITMRYSTQ